MAGRVRLASDTALYTMKTATQVFLLSFLICLCGCSMTLPVKGRFESGNVTFIGTATGYLDGSGTLSMTSNNGLKIEGNFVYVTRRNGEGTFTCSDGRSGSFQFVSTGKRGTGTGHLGNDRVTFTFGFK